MNILQWSVITLRNKSLYHYWKSEQKSIAPRYLLSMESVHKLQQRDSECSTSSTYPDLPSMNRKKL